MHKPAAFIALCSLPVAALAYDPPIHGILTHLTVVHHNRCVSVQIPACVEQLLVDANEGEDGWTARRALNWHFHARDENDAPVHLRYPWLPGRKTFDRVIGWINEDLAQGPSAQDHVRLVGRALHYVQDVTVPAHVVPVRHGFIFGKDGFDGYAVAENVSQSDVQCPGEVAAFSLDEHIDAVAKATRDEARKDWASFWNREKPDEWGWGAYGDCGNTFGQDGAASGKCAEKDRKQFAGRRHAAAINAGMALLAAHRKVLTNPEVCKTP